MPANCSADVQAVIEEVDNVLSTGNPQEIQAIKANFGLQDIVHLDDFASASMSPSCLCGCDVNADELESALPVESVFNYWQDGDVSTRSDGFYAFCDALEVASNGKHAPASGWGLKTALQAWGNLWNQSLYPASTYRH